MATSPQTEGGLLPAAHAQAQFEKMWRQALPIVAKLVPKHIDPAHVFSVALTARQRNPKLLDCTDISVLRCAILSAQFGLDVSGIGGKAYMIPYWNGDKRIMEAQFQFGWRGLVELAMRTGRIAGVYAREVYDGELFEYSDGIQQHLRHVPAAEAGEVVAAWAVGVHTNGFRQPEVLFRHQIEARRAVSKAPDGPAWKNWFPEMAKKTVIRLLCKKLPDSAELSYALDTEDRADLGLPPLQEIELDALEAVAQAPKSRTEAVKERVRENIDQAAGEEPSDDDAAAGEREPGAEG